MDEIYIKSRTDDKVELEGGLSNEISLTSDQNDKMNLKGTLYVENNLKGMIDFTKGDKGDKGETGNSAFEDWLLQDGNAGKTFEEFMESLKGEDGSGMTEEETFDGGSS